jgi:DNA-binding MarR family transcriptional regulator
MPTTIPLGPSPVPAGRVGLLDAVRDAQRAVVVRLMPEVLSRGGITPHQFWPLYHLGREAESHPGELARRLGITMPACTASVDQLVAAGLIVRRRSATDRRRVVLALTPKGRRVLTEVGRRFGRGVAAATVGVPERDVATTARVLRVLADQLRAQRPVGPRAREAA